MLRLLLTAALASCAHAALAACLPLDEFTAQVAEKFHEVPAVLAKVGKVPIVIFVAPGGATFTIVGIVQNGKMACTMGDGTDWMVAPPRPPAPPARGL